MSEFFVPSYAAGTRAADFAWWCGRHLVQSVDRFAGKPLVLEDWQNRFFCEGLAVDEQGLPYWQMVLLVVARKNGKSAMLSAYSLYHLLEDTGSPEVLLAASSDKQAGRLFDGAVSFVRQSPDLAALTHLREYVGEIARVDGLGKILRMASDPNRAHGYNPSLVVADELHAFTTPSLRKAWGAFVSGGGARDFTQVFAISTAGEALERDESILGHLIDRNEARGQLEQEPGLTISRNHEAKVLVYNYSAPTSDRHDIAALKLANPASWITEAYLREQAESPALTDAEVLQLHGCVWAAGEDQWIDATAWEACGDGAARVPDRASVYVGVDMSLKEDCSAVAWACELPDGRVFVDAHVWSSRPDVVADEYVKGDIDPRLIESFITDRLAVRFQVREIVYDPALFSRSAHELGERFTVAPVGQTTKTMAEAWSTWFSAVNNRTVVHAGGRTLAAHVTNAVAEHTDQGWKVRKSRQNRKIDALVASAIAHWRAAVSAGPSVYEERDLLVL